MKKHCLIFLFAIIGISLNAQGSFRIKVVDSKTTEGIPKALVFIEEIPIPDQETDAFGLVTYQNVPQDRKVRVNVRKKGYLPQQVEIVASKAIKVDNNIVIKLEKESSIPQVTIYGEVTDKNNEEIGGASVEVTIVGKPFFGVTDASGNYQIRIDRNTLKSLTSFQIEVKKKGCERTKTTEALLQSDYIEKNIRLSCSDEEIVIAPTEAIAIETVNEIEVSIKKFEQKGTRAVFHLTFENKSLSKTIQREWISSGSHVLIDQSGTQYKSKYARIGSISDQYATLVTGNVVEGVVEFEVGSSKITKAQMLTIQYWQNFVFTNVKL